MEYKTGDLVRITSIDESDKFWGIAVGDVCAVVDGYGDDNGAGIKTKEGTRTMRADQLELAERASISQGFYGPSVRPTSDSRPIYFDEAGSVPNTIMGRIRASRFTRVARGDH
jgi:hypothetical protein